MKKIIKKLIIFRKLILTNQKERNLSNTGNQSQFYLTKEQFNDATGYNYIIESLQIYLMTLLNFFGLILGFRINPNKFSFYFYILKNKRFNTIPLFGYLKVYTLNSSIISVLMFFNFLFYPFDFSYSYGLKFYYCYVYIGVFIFTYFYSAALGVNISLERLLNFLPSIKKLKKISYKTLSLVLFVVVFAITFPIFFVFEPTFIEVSFDGVNVKINIIFIIFNQT